MSLTENLVPVGVTSYQAHVERDINFALDQVHVLLRAKSRDGHHLAEAVEVTFGPPVDPYVAVDPVPRPFLTLSTEAAEALFNALARYFLGTTDVARLRDDLARERRRVDALISGIGRMAGVGT